MEVHEAERIEIEHWASSETERPGVFSIENLINKVTDAPVLLGRLAPFRDRFTSANRVLELGAGQGWASCLLRSLHGRPSQGWFCTDISRHALQSLPAWGGVFRSRPSGAAACRAYQLPFPDGTFDVVFAFQAAHHFRLHRETLQELHRVLVPGGLGLYSHEPTCPRWIHPLAVRRVRSGRPEVPEDVLLHEDVLKAARAVGLSVACRDDCSLEKRRPLEYVYYLVLGRIPPLRALLPCTRDYVFEKTTQR